MKAFLAKLSLRERQLIYIGAAVALFLIPVLVWLSLHGRVERLQSIVHGQRVLDQWMRTAAQQAVQLRGASARRRSGKVTDKSLLALVDQTARQAGLHNALKRVEPDKDNSVRVWFEAVVFDDMVRWLSSIRTSYGVEVNGVTVDRQPQAGIVNARLVLKGSA